MWRWLILGLLVGGAWGQWDVDLVIFPNPSPFLADWENNPGNAAVTVTYTGSEPSQIQLYLRLEREGSTILEAWSLPIDIPPGPYTLVVDNTDLVDRDRVSYSSEFEEQAIRTGRFPAGLYTLCVEVQHLPDQTPLASDCETYEFIDPAPPSLISPADLDTLPLPFPTFTWTPVTAPPGYPVTYHLKIVEAFSGQPRDLNIEAPAFYETDIENLPLFVYPMDAPPLEDGKTYLWRVQAFDSTGTPLGQNSGRSEVFAFTYASLIPGGTGLFGDTLVIVENAAYLLLSDLSQEETDDAYIFNGTATLHLPIIPGNPGISVSVNNLTVSKTDFSITDGSFSGDIDPGTFPEEITRGLLNFTGLDFSVPTGITFDVELQIPEALGGGNQPLTGTVTVTPSGLSGSLEGTGSPLFSAGNDNLGFECTYLEVHFSSPVLSAEGNLTIFGETVPVQLDSLRYEGGELRGRLRATPEHTFDIVPDYAYLRLDSLKGRFSTADFDLNLWGGFSLDFLDTPCGGTFALSFTPSGLNVDEFNTNCDEALSQVAMDWLNLGLRNLDLVNLAWDAVTGWDFTLSLDVRLAFPSIPDLDLPWLSGIQIGTEGIAFPDIHLTDLGLPPFDFGGFGLSVNGLSIDAFTLPWPGTGGFSWPDDVPIHLDLAFKMPNLPDVFPDCMRNLSLDLNDVSLSGGTFSFTLPTQTFPDPGCEIPLGGDVAFYLTQLGGSFSASLSGGLSVDGSVDISGKLSLPSELVCPDQSGPLDLTAFTLHIQGDGTVLGTIEDLVPPCPLDLGALKVHILTSTLTFDTTETGDQRAILDLQGQVKLPAPSPPPDSITAEGELVFDLIGADLIDGYIAITSPFLWNLPSEEPILSFRIDSARIDTAGFHIAGTGRLNLLEGEYVGVNFNNLVLDLSDFHVKSGSADFVSSFGFRLNPSEPDLGWAAVAAAASLPEDWTSGLLMALPENISLQSGGLAIRDSSMVTLRWEGTDYTLKARFSDDFLLTWTPSFGVASGQVEFFLDTTRVAWLDPEGLHVNLAGAINIPAKLGLPDTSIAYLKLRDDEGNLLIDFTLDGTQLHLATREGEAVYLYIPALSTEDWTPNLGVTFSVTVDPVNFAFVDGSIDVTPPEGLDTLFSLRRLGLPLDVTELHYLNLEDTYGLILSAGIELPEVLGGLNLVFDSLRITSDGLTGTARLGTVHESHSAGETYLDSLDLDFLRLLVNGAEVDFEGPQVRFSGDVAVDLFEEEGGSRMPIHFWVSVGTEGLDFNIEPPDTLPISVAQFIPQNLMGHPPIDISVGDTFALELSGTFTLPMLGEGFEVSFTGFKVMNVEPYVVVPEIHYPSPEQFFELFGLEFGIRDITEGGEVIPGVAFSYEDGVFYVELSGEVTFLDNTVTFRRLRIGTNGDISIESADLLSEPLAIIEGHLTIDSLHITEDHLRVAGSVNLPEPFDDAGTQHFGFNIGFDGSVSGDNTIYFVNEPTPTLGGGDDTEWDLWIGKLDLLYLAVTLTPSDWAESHVDLVSAFWFDDTKKVDLGYMEGGTPHPFLTFAFSGDLDWHEENVRVPDALPDIDWEALKLNINNLTFVEGSFGLSFSGSFRLNLDVCSGGIEFTGFQIHSDGSVDWPTITGGDLTIADIVALSVSEITYRDPDVDTTLRVKRKTPDGDTSTVVIEHVDSYFSFGLEMNIIDVASGGVERFLAYSLTDGGFGFIIQDANLGIPSLLDMHLDMEFETGEDFRLVMAGFANIIPVETQIAAYGKVATVGGEPSFGLFAAVNTRIDIIPGLIILSGVGGGFFYNPEESDITRIKELSGVPTEIASGIDVPTTEFAVLLYASASVVSEWAANGRVLVTVTDQYFNLDGRVELLNQENRIRGDIHLGVGFQHFFAEGNVRVLLDIASLIEGDGNFGFFVYGTDVWGIQGGLDLDILTIISAESEFFIGPPGFYLMAQSEVSYNFWIVEFSSGMRTEFWYMEAASWGGYMKTWISAEVLSGAASAEGWLEGCLLGTEGNYYLYGVAGLSVCVGWGAICWDGSIWAKISNEGFDGGFGRDSEMERLIAEAREQAQNMNEAAQEAQQAMEEASASAYTLSEEQMETAFRYAFRNNGMIFVLGLAEASVGGYPPELQNVAQEVYGGEDAPPADDTLQIQALENTLETYREIINTLRPQAEATLNQIRVLLQEAGAIPEYEPQNPVQTADFTLSAYEANGYMVVTDTPEVVIDPAQDQANEAGLSTFEEDVSQLQGFLEQQIRTLRDSLRSIDLLTSGPILDSVAHAFSMLDAYHQEYYARYSAYANRLSNWAGGRYFQLGLDSSAIYNAIINKTNSLSLSQIKQLAMNRKYLAYLMANEGDEEAAQAQLAAVDTSGKSVTWWRNFCNSNGFELWYQIPREGTSEFYEHYNQVGNQLRFIFHTTYEDSVEAPHIQFTQALDQIHEVRHDLTTSLYDLADRYLFWTGEDTVPSGPTPPSLPPGWSPGGWVPPGFGGGLPPGWTPPGAGTELTIAEIREEALQQLAAPTLYNLQVTITNQYDYADMMVTFDAYHPYRLLDAAYRLRRSSAGYPWMSLKSAGNIVPATTMGEYPKNGTGHLRFFVLPQNDPDAAPDGVEEDFSFKFRVRGGAGASLTQTLQIPVPFGNRDVGTEHTYTLEDNTPPYTPSVSLPYPRKTIGPHQSSQERYSRNTQEIHASWSSSDPESDISEYLYQVAHKTWMWVPGGWWGGGYFLPTYEPLMDWTSAATITEMTIRGLHLEHNERYVVRVLAINGEGDTSDVGVSTELVIDTTAPPPATITPWYTMPSGGPPVPPALYFTLTADPDPESGTRRFLVRLDTIPHTSYSDPDAWGSISYRVWEGPSRDIQFIGDTLVQYNRQYYLSVFTQNTTGKLSDSATIYGPITPPDPTPPSRPNIWVYTGTWWPRTDSLKLIIGSFADDPETHIKGYQIRIETPTGTLLRDWSSDGQVDILRSSIPEGNLSAWWNLPDGLLQHDNEYVLKIRAVNGYGTPGEACVYSFRVDTTLPPPPSVVDLQYLSPSHKIVFTVNVPEDPESGIMGVFLLGGYVDSSSVYSIPQTWWSIWDLMEYMDTAPSPLFPDDFPMLLGNGPGVFGNEVAYDLTGYSRVYLVFGTMNRARSVTLTVVPLSVEGL